MVQITTTAATAPALTHILQHLRAEDQHELEAMRGEGFDTFRMALELSQLASTHAGWVFWNAHTSEPIAALGAYAMTPVVAGCWAFGTAQFPLAVRAVTKHVRKVMIPNLLKAGFHRAECRALASRSDTERWLTSLGWKAEAVLVGFGNRREDFILFAWLADERTHHPPEPQRESEVQVR